MIEKIQKYITNRNLFLKTDRLLLAISGGSDSVFLFFVLKELGYKIEFAHCNFNLRGDESNQDQEFVKSLATKYNIQCYFKSFETVKYAHKEKISVQMAARILRYKWFDELSVNFDLDFIITAHHKDDNIETFLINLIRGSGINGLSGIRVKNKKIIRPLLEISKQEIESYLHKKKIKYRTDSSNTDVKYLRSQIRHRLIPLLKEMNPNIQKVIANEIFVLDEVRQVFQLKIEKIRKQLLIKKNECYKIDISELVEFSPLEILLFELLSPFGFSNVAQIKKAIFSQSGKKFFSHSYQLIIDRDEIVISLLQDSQDEIYLLDVEKQIDIPLKIKFVFSNDLSLDVNPNIAKLDFDKLFFPLVLRKWKHGDRFQPLGMQNFKKLSDFFIDEKYSLIDKENQWILCSKNEIVWIVGKRIDERYKVENDTKKVYIAELLEKE